MSRFLGLEYISFGLFGDSNGEVDLGAEEVWMFYRRLDNISLG